MNIQNELPESPAELQVPKRSVGRPKGSRRLSPDSIQIDHVTYPHIPSKLWKQLNAVTSSFLATIGSQLEAAYAEGVETKMVDLMDEALPDAALALGLATMEALATQDAYSTQTDHGFHAKPITFQAMKWPLLLGEIDLPAVSSLDNFGTLWTLRKIPIMKKANHPIGHEGHRNLRGGKGGQTLGGGRAAGRVPRRGLSTLSTATQRW